MFSSRTRLAISWVYWLPKSRINTLSCCMRKINHLDYSHNPMFIILLLCSLFDSVEISIKKFKDKQSVLTITRDDGSSTWAKLHNGTELHDLAHYAVESVLQFKHAFFGIINRGFTIEDFEAPRGERPDEVKAANMQPEALITEHLVNLLQIELITPGYNLDLIDQLRDILSDNNLPFPDRLNDEKLNSIREVYRDLFRRWTSLEIGDQMNLELKL